MAIVDPCSSEDALLMFLDGALPADEQARVAAHTAGCPSCSAALTDARDLSAALRDAAQSPASPQEPCPTAWTLVQYSDGGLDEETARHVRAHLFWCEDCLAEVLALEQERAEPLPLQEALTQYLARWQVTRAVSPLAAAGETVLTMPAQVHGPAGTPEHLTLAVLFGPMVSPEGRFSLDLRVPEAPWCEGREVRVTLHLDPYTFDMPSRVERATITLNYSLPGDYQNELLRLCGASWRTRLPRTFCLPSPLPRPTRRERSHALQPPGCVSWIRWPLCASRRLRHGGPGSRRSCPARPSRSQRHWRWIPRCFSTLCSTVWRRTIPRCRRRRAGTWRTKPESWRPYSSRSWKRDGTGIACMGSLPARGMGWYALCGSTYARGDVDTWPIACVSRALRRVP